MEFFLRLTGGGVSAAMGMHPIGVFFLEPISLLVDVVLGFLGSADAALVTLLPFLPWRGFPRRFLERQPCLISFVPPFVSFFCSARVLPAHGPCVPQCLFFFRAALFRL